MAAIGALYRLVLEEPNLVRPWLELIRALSARHSDLIAQQEGAADAKGASAPLQPAASPAATLVNEFNAINEVFERAVAHLPGSYKLWTMYAEARMFQCEVLGVPDRHFVCDIFERALKVLPQMPGLWLRYAAFCRAQGWITRARVVHEKALQHLPPTQHARVWSSFKAFLSEGAKPVDLVVPVMRRHLLFDTSFEAQVEYIGMLADRACTAEVLSHAAKVLIVKYRNNISGATGLWSLVSTCLASLDTSDPQTKRITNEEAVALVRCGAEEHPPSATALSIALASFLTARGAFAEARAALQSNLRATRTTADFFDCLTALAEFEFSLMSKVLEAAASAPDCAIDAGLLEQHLYPGARTLDEAFEQLSELINSHQLLYNNAMLRAEPRFVAYWLKRAELTSEMMHTAAAIGADGAGSSAPAAASARYKAVTDVYSQAVHACSHSPIAAAATSSSEGEAGSGVRGHFHDDESDDAEGEGGGGPEAANVEGATTVSFRLGLPVLRPMELFIAWADFCFGEGCAEDGLQVLERGALEGNFDTLAENEALFCLLIERLIALQRPFESAIRPVILRATTAPPAASAKRLRRDLFSRAKQGRPLWRRRGVWQAATDVVAAQGAEGDAVRLFERMRNCGMYTPLAAIDHARILCGDRFDNAPAAYRALEAAAESFAAPGLKDPSAVVALYTELLSTAVGRECPARIEWCREVFEEALARVVAMLDTSDAAALRRRSVHQLLDCYSLFARYATMERQHGFFSNAVSIAQRAVALFRSTKIEYLAQDHLLDATEALLGATAAAHTAFVLLDALVKQRQTVMTLRRIGQLALRFASCEEAAGRPERGREVISQCCSLLPPTEPRWGFFWSAWEDFEARCGDARTLREMNVFKRGAHQRATASEPLKMK